MGYLELGSGFSNSAKMIIAFWFRTPSASLASAVTDPGQVLMSGCVPLIAFGEPNADHDGNDLGPSFIGVDTISDSVPGIGAAIHCDRIGSFTGTYFTGDGPCNPATPASPPARDYFRIQPGGSGYRIATPPDRWHHLLLSFDFTGGINVSNDPRASWGTSGANWQCWASLDGVNFNGTALNSSSLASNVLHGGPNQMLSIACDAVPVQETTPQLYTQSGWNDPPADTIPNCTVTADFLSANYTIGGAEVPGSGFALGVPCVGDYNRFIQTVEMADLQIYTGVTTSDASLFITSGKPAAISKSSSALGTSPLIYLGGDSSRWIAGTNGATGGNLNPVGTITKYDTGPSL